MTKTPCNDHDDISVHIIQSFYYDPAHSVGVAKLYSMYIQLLVNGQKWYFIKDYEHVIYYIMTV